MAVKIQHGIAIICVYFALVLLPGCQSFKHKVLYISGYVPIDTSASGGYSAAGMLSAVQMGFEDVNNSTKVLQDYRLQVDWSDTHCLAGYSTSLFMKDIARKPTKIMLVGDGCSMSTAPIAETCPYYNLLMISYIAASPILSNKQRYKTFFRMAMPDSSYNGPRIAVMQRLNWTRFATIHQLENSNYFSLMTTDLLNRLKERNIPHSIVALESFRDDPRDQVENLLRKDARVIIVNMYSSKARLVFCWAYKLGLINTTIQRVWMIPGYYASNWWNSTSTPCTPQELKQAINYVILTDTLNLRQDGKKSIAGMTGPEYAQRLERHPQSLVYKPSSYNPFGYDTAWAVALALNKTLNVLKSDPSRYNNRLLEDFNYNDTEMQKIMLREMFGLRFEGVSGAVKFDKYGDRSGTLTVLQHVNGTRNYVALYDSIKENLQMKSRFYWRDNRVPSDGSKNTTVVILLKVNFSLCMVMVAMSAIGIAISGVFFHANYKYHHTPIMKMSSAKLNVFICIGAMLMYLSIVCYAIYQGLKYSNPSYTTAMCELWKWLLPIGFTLAFGAIFSKTFRIYIIYASVQGKPRRRKLLDKSLFQLIGLLVFIDVIILSLWSGIDPLRPEVKIIDSRVSNDDPDTRIEKRMTTCTSPYMIYWMLILGTEKAVFLLFGAVVAYGTRNISNKELNDSKLITIVVYNFILIAIVTGPLRFALHSMAPTGYFAADSILMWLCITTMLFIIFIPKLKRVNKVSSQDLLKSSGNLQGSVDRSTGNYNRANSASGSIDSIIDSKGR